MRIDHLYVRNFRCFETQEFSFHPTFNVLIGDNATGKTAVLKALRIAAASWFLGIKDPKTVHIRPDDVRLKGRAFEAGEYDFQEQWPVEVTATGTFAATEERGEEQIQWTRTLKGPRGRTTRKGANRMKARAEEADQRVRDGDTVGLPLVAYYGTSRLYLEPRQTQQRKEASAKRGPSRFVGYQDAIDKRLDTQALTRWMKRQSWMAWQEGETSTLYQVVSHAITQMVEEASAIRYDPNREEVVVTIQDQTLPFDYLSDGQRTTLTLVGDLAIRAARLNPHLGEAALQNTPGVVLIDELGMHLHPSWQRHIIRDLQRVFPRLQFMTTTHSPQIISEMENGSVLSLERGEGEIKVREVESYGLDSNWVLQHIMGVSARPDEIDRRLRDAEKALDQQEYEQARALVKEVRQKALRTSGDVTRLQSKIDTLEMLSSDAENS